MISRIVLACGIFTASNSVELQSDSNSNNEVTDVVDSSDNIVQKHIKYFKQQRNLIRTIIVINTTFAN
jgi:hypothetical protein